MKKQFLSSAIALAISAPVQAAVLIGNYGASTTLGQVATPVTINSVLFNPAAGYLALDHKNGEDLRLGYLSQLGASMEFGEADNFQDDVDVLITRLDDFDTKLNSGAYGADINSAYSDAKGIQDEFNTVLASFGDSGRLKTSFTASVPGLPVVFELPKVPGVLSIDASFGLISLAAFDDQPFTGLPDDISSITSVSDLQNFKTDSQVVVRGGTLAQLGLGYSQAINTLKEIGTSEGELIVGAKANLYRASLTSVKAKIDRDDSKEVSDLISDGLDAAKDSTAFGVDVGAVWAASNYQLGLTIKNLIAPEFDAYEKDDVKGTEGETKIKLDPQTTLDGAIFVKDRMLMLAASADMNKVDDLVGDEVQMLHLSGTFFPSSAAIPTVRLGYEKNLAGEELSAVNFGLGLFRGVANFDVTYGLETAEVDGSDLPRRLGIQLSFEETF